ncbi:hypothetical protein LXA43DRAFT_678850 [Ganoderma leucocontextum]|nr:hypothetical protein LXA43DRAFT_678850 [Ganoderma leucocontextum]
MFLFNLPIKFFMWLNLLMIHTVSMVIFLLLWLQHRDQRGMMILWILEATIMAVLLARTAVCVCHHIWRTSRTWKLEYSGKFLMVFLAAVDFVKGVFVLIQLITPSSDDPNDLGRLARDLGATNVVYVCLISVSFALITWFAIGFETFLAIIDAEVTSEDYFNDSGDIRWINRSLVRPRSPAPSPRPWRALNPQALPTTRIVGVQHGTPPEMWVHKPGDRERRRVVAPDPLQSVRPVYDPRAPRRLRTPPPIKTTWNQWYITPGEAV